MGYNVAMIIKSYQETCQYLFRGFLANCKIKLLLHILEMEIDDRGKIMWCQRVAAWDFPASKQDQIIQEFNGDFMKLTESIEKEMKELLDPRF